MWNFSNRFQNFMLGWKLGIANIDVFLHFYNLWPWVSGFEKRPLLCNGVFGCHGNIYYVILIGAVFVWYLHMHTVQITFIFIGQTHLVFGKRVCTCVTKHSNAFRTFLNWLKNSKRVWHQPKLHILRLPIFANFDRWSVSVGWV